MTEKLLTGTLSLNTNKQNFKQDFQKLLAINIGQVQCPHCALGQVQCPHCALGQVQCPHCALGQVQCPHCALGHKVRYSVHIVH